LVYLHERSATTFSPAENTHRQPADRTRAACQREEALISQRYYGIHVECYSGYRGEEEPRRFIFQDSKLEVIEILDRWLDPGHRYFKVKAGDGGVYILRHAAHSGLWELTVYLEGKK
jgi:hypothetical protein